MRPPVIPPRRPPPLQGACRDGVSVGTGSDVQGATLCLQGEPGIKGDRGEPGQRGQNGSPVSPCPAAPRACSTRLSPVLSGLESALPGTVSGEAGMGDEMVWP